MDEASVTNPEQPKRRKRPPLTQEAEENQMINLAYNLARKQLEEGTASSQVITHFLKLAAEKERSEIEKEILQKQRDLVVAKTEDLKSRKQSEEFYERVIAALRSYNGQGDNDEYQDIF